MLIVKKFGGSSLSDMEKLKTAAENCAEENKKGNKTLVVVSARGDSTDELENMAREIITPLPARERDALLSTGEIQSAALMAMMLRKLGVPAVSLTGAQAGILTDANHGDAEILSIDTDRVIELLNNGIIPSVCGFQGADSEGNITTLGRGGSDTTAVVLAAALKADRCEIYTDVDGVYTADPRYTENAVKLSELDYDDMLALSEAGAKVLHSKCVLAAKKSGTEIRVLPAYYRGEGTLIRHLPQRNRFAGVALDNNGRITVVGTLADGDVRDRLIHALTDGGIAVSRAEHGKAYIRIDTAPDNAPKAVNIIHAELLK